jgi:hypothetical protein
VVSSLRGLIHSLFMVSLVTSWINVDIELANKASYRQCPLLDIAAARPTMVNQTSMFEHNEEILLLHLTILPLSIPHHLLIKSQIPSSLAEDNKSFGRRYTSLEYQVLTNTLNYHK